MKLPPTPQTRILKRRSIRKKGHDYSSPGYYFITINAKEKQHIFGEVVDSKVVLSETGLIVEKHWNRVPAAYPNMHIDASVIMPNHFHALIRITEQIEARPLSKMINSFKAYANREVNELRHTKGSSIWHRNYYERILTTKSAVEEVRRYILQNPAAWQAKHAT